MRATVSILLGLSLLLAMHVQAAVTEYEILFTATLGPDGAGRFTYDDTPGAERLSDIPVDFGPVLNGIILTPTYPPPFDDEELYLFDVLSNANDFFQSYTKQPEELIGFDFFTFHSYTFLEPSEYEIYTLDLQGNSILTGTGTFAISAVPIPAGLPLFGSALVLLGFTGWRRRTTG